MVDTPRSNGWRQWGLWTVACAVGLLVAAGFAGALSGMATAIVMAFESGDTGKLADAPAAGAMSGLIFALLMGAPAIAYAVLGGDAAAGPAGQVVMAMATLAAAGLAIGVFQFDVLRRNRLAHWSWITATIVGWMLAGALLPVVLNKVVLPIESTTAIVPTDGAHSATPPAATWDSLQWASGGCLMGLLGGSASGALQSLVLRQRRVRVGWWVPVNAAGWALGGAVAALVFTGAGLVLGGAIAGLITGPILFRLLQPPSAAKRA